MKVCAGFLTQAQVTPHGHVRQCCFMKFEHFNIGNLLYDTLEEIWNGEKNRRIFDHLARGDYSLCNAVNCPYLHDDGTPKNVPLMEVEGMPEWPMGFGISYEHVCNYKCTCCESHNEMSEEIIREYDLIEKNLESCLPRLKHINFNGYGEIFVSKRTLNLLANWKPLAPKEEVSVRLISNGSLFDEKHWKQIENVGQYNLEVQVSVMSFDDHIHRTLSGTNVPISTVEKNLHFVKELRKAGIVNRFIISSVVQDRNFRTMPEFARRCVEEFEPDLVRLQPVIFIDPNNFERWLLDVRNKYHPYHQEYLEIMSDPIFKHPTVQDYGAWRESGVGELAVLKNATIIQQARQQEGEILRELFNNPAALNNIEQKMGVENGSIIIHGAGALGMAITKSLFDRGKIKISHITDFKQKGVFLDIPIINVNEKLTESEEYDKSLPVLFTWPETQQKHFDYFRSLGYTGKFITLKEIFDCK